MLRLLLIIAWLFSCLSAVAIADEYIPGSVKSVNGCTTSCTVQLGNFIGTYTVSTLPTCDNVTTPYGSVAYVTDLGGGANNAKCINGFWQHFTLGVPATLTNTSGSITVTPLASPPIMVMTGSIGLGVTVPITINTSGLYPGYDLKVVRPSALLGGITIGVLGLGTINILGSTRNEFIWDGTTLQQVQ